MIKTKFIFAVSFLAMFVATDYALGAIASSGYVDQQVGTRLSSITGSTTGEGNVVTEVTADGSTITATKGINAEVTSNKATAESVVADDKGSTEKYPSVAAAEKIAEVAAQAVSENSLQKDGALTEGNLLKSDVSGKVVDSGVASDKVLTNTATGSNSFSTGGAMPAAQANSVALGRESTADDSSTATGYNSIANGGKSVALGYWAKTEKSNGTALGTQAAVYADFGTAVGAQASVSGAKGIAIGTGAKSSANSAVQLGVGENSEANTLSVGLAQDKNYKLLGSDGKIPAERLPFEGDVLTNAATGSASLGVGDRINVAGEASVAVGVNSFVSQDLSVAVGSSAAVDGTGSYGVAIGSGAKAHASNAIQLGKGENSEANTFSVGLSDSNNYKLLGSDGKIPAERLPFEGNVVTNPATGLFSLGIGDAKPLTADYSVAIGKDSEAVFDRGVAVGVESVSNGFHSVALGANAYATAEGAIQLGAGGNTEKDTLQVRGYRLMEADGTIPLARMPETVLYNTATGTDSFSIGNAWPVSGNDSLAIGDVATTGVGNSSLAIGASAVASTESVVVGAGSNSAGPGVALLGTGSSATGNYSVAVGYGLETEGEHSVSIGGNATKDYAIQLGQGTNSEANTLSVGFGLGSNFKLLGSDGKIPVERLPVDGNFLTNTATGDRSFSTGGAMPVAVADSFAIGKDAKAEEESGVAIGPYTTAGGESVAVGYESTARGGGTALGPAASAGAYNSVAIGYTSNAESDYSVAIGGNANQPYAIQLGHGTNNEPNTFSVGLNYANSYKLLGSDGKIPAERLPFEGDVLTNTATGENSFSTGGATPVTGMGAVALGAQAQSNGSLSTSIGYNSQTKDFSGSVALGGAASVTGIYGTALGASSSAGISSVAVGRGAKSNGDNSIAVGSFATAEADNAIQLGNGINSEASTFNVALGANNYRLLNTGGKIPAERLPAAMIPVGSSTSPTSYATFWIE